MASTVLNTPSCYAISDFFHAEARRRGGWFFSLRVSAAPRELVVVSGGGEVSVGGGTVSVFSGSGVAVSVGGVCCNAVSVVLSPSPLFASREPLQVPASSPSALPFRTDIPNAASATGPCVDETAGACSARTDSSAADWEGTRPAAPPAKAKVRLPMCESRSARQPRRRRRVRPSRPHSDTARGCAFSRDGSPAIAR